MELSKCTITDLEKKKSQKKTLHFINVTTLCHIDRLLVWQKSNQMVERHAPICQSVGISYGDFYISVLLRVFLTGPM